MRVLIFLLTTIAFLNANIDYVLRLISKIENRKYEFVNVKYKLSNTQIPVKTKKSNLIEFSPLKEKIDFTVKAIFNNLVLINNKWLKVGESYKGFKVIKIAKDYIIIQKNNKSYVINIKPKMGL